MAEYDNTNRGVLFKNNLKEEGSKQPDYTGTGNLNGDDFQISAWLKEGKTGKFFSFSFSPPYQKEDKPKSVDTSDDIPF
jgi:hypothetical protein